MSHSDHREPIKDSSDKKVGCAIYLIILKCASFTLLFFLAPLRELLKIFNSRKSMSDFRLMQSNDYKVVSYL